jgi:hypothetical protein
LANEYGKSILGNIPKFCAATWQSYIITSVARKKTSVQETFADNIGFGRAWLSSVFIKGSKKGTKLQGGVVKLFDCQSDDDVTESPKSGVDSSSSSKKKKNSKAPNSPEISNTEYDLVHQVESPISNKKNSRKRKPRVSSSDDSDFIPSNQVFGQGQNIRKRRAPIDQKSSTKVKNNKSGSNDPNPSTRKIPRKNADPNPSTRKIPRKNADSSSPVTVTRSSAYEGCSSTSKTTKRVKRIAEKEKKKTTNTQPSPKLANSSTTVNTDEIAKDVIEKVMAAFSNMQNLKIVSTEAPKVTSARTRKSRK